MPFYRQYGAKGLKAVEHFVLIIIAIATVVAIGQEIVHIFNAGAVALADLLLLFIYLEVLAMVANYAESGKLPVRMPLYIAIVALARYLILDMKSMDDWRIAAISLSTLILAATVIVIRWGQLKCLTQKSRIRQLITYPSQCHCPHSVALPSLFKTLTKDLAFTLVFCQKAIMLVLQRSIIYKAIKLWVSIIVALKKNAPLCESIWKQNEYS